jgi:hypothetical protein
VVCTHAFNDVSLFRGPGWLTERERERERQLQSVAARVRVNVYMKGEGNATQLGYVAALERFPELGYSPSYKPSVLEQKP